MNSDPNPDLTPEERAWLASPHQDRGYAPLDDISEPEDAPSGPGAVSPLAATVEEARAVQSGEGT